MLSQLTQIKSDPLDVLLFAVGLRLTQLAKMGDDKFKGLLEFNSAATRNKRHAIMRLITVLLANMQVQPKSQH